MENEGKEDGNKPRTELLNRCPIPGCDCFLTAARVDGEWRIVCPKHRKRRFRRLTKEEIKKYRLNSSTRRT